jgi:hypothetical protein
MLLLALVLLSAAPAHALLRCRPPADLIVVYPANGSTLSLEPTVFLRWRSRRPAIGGTYDLVLARRDGASVELAVEPRRSSGLILVRPKQPLRPGSYILRWNKPTADGVPDSSVEAPGWQHESGKLVLRFKALGAPRAGAPELGSGAVQISAWADAEPGNPKAMVPGRGAGRYAHLAARPRSGRPAPAVLELKIAYAGAQPLRIELPLAFAPSVEFGTLPVRCGHPLSLPGVPRTGSYAIEVAPWSAHGVRGRPLLLKGGI